MNLLYMLINNASFKRKSNWRKREKFKFVAWIFLLELNFLLCRILENLEKSRKLTFNLKFYTSYQIFCLKYYECQNSLKHSSENKKLVIWLQASRFYVLIIVIYLNRFRNRWIKRFRWNSIETFSRNFNLFIFSTTRPRSFNDL